MRSSILFLLSLISTISLFAQTDSASFSKIKWRNEKVAPGIHLKQSWFRGNSLFNANEFISVLEIKPRRKNKLSLAYEIKTKKLTSEFGTENNALTAINGTFFDVANGGSVDFIRSKGQIINENILNKNGTRAVHQQAALVLNKGKLQIDQWDGSPDWEKNLAGEDVMLTGPLLLLHDQYIKLDSNSFNVTRHPRSAIAVTVKKRVLLITIDGRAENSAGVSLFELQQIMHWLKCRDGINLDGGGSTTLWIKQKGVVNYPSDNKKWDHEGQRKVANVVLVERK